MLIQLYGLWCCSTVLCYTEMCFLYILFTMFISAGCTRLKVCGTDSSKVWEMIISCVAVWSFCKTSSIHIFVKATECSVNFISGNNGKKKSRPIFTPPILRSIHSKMNPLRVKHDVKTKQLEQITKICTPFIKILII